VYRIVADPATFAQIAALPDEAMKAYAEVLGVVRLMPWNGQPQHRDNPEGAVRRWPFGAGQAGQVIYPILEEQHEVHLLLVQWWT
jgi:hypothetical protein